MRRLAWLSIALVLPALPARAQDRAPGVPPARPTIVVSEEAVVTVSPDRAEIDLAVVTQAATAKEAADKNATTARTVMQQVRPVLATGAEVQTVGYSIQPDYRYREGARPTISGYTARNTVRVVTDRLADVGPVIDAATRGGANEVQRLQYRLRDDDAATARALEQAAHGARAKADALARALGVKIVRVFQVTESQPGVVQPMMMAMAKSADGGTPIEAGTIEVRATVTLTVEISP